VSWPLAYTPLKVDEEVLAMLGRQSEPDDGDHPYLDHVRWDSFYGFLALHREELFCDEDFADLYCPDNGRPSVPPSLLATALLLQFYEGVSDEEAKARADFDLRWKVALGIGLEERPFAKSTLQLFRAWLMQLGVRQARYFGRTKTCYQLLMAATVANLTLAATRIGLMRDRNHPQTVISTHVYALFVFRHAFTTLPLRSEPGFSATLLALRGLSDALGATTGLAHAAGNAVEVVSARSDPQPPSGCSSEVRSPMPARICGMQDVNFLVDKAAASLPARLRWRIGAQPQRNVGWLHRLPYHAYQIIAHGIQVRLIPFANHLGQRRTGGGCDLNAVCTYDQALLEGRDRGACLQRHHVPPSYLPHHPHVLRISYENLPYTDPVC
jgi:Transposase domain (DUF772)